MVTFDLPIKVPAYPRVHVKPSTGRRMIVDAPDRLARLHAFYDELKYRLPPRIRNARLAGPIAISLVFWKSGGRCGDVDNLAKSVLDGLVRARVMEDDDQVVDLRARLIHGKGITPRLVGAIAEVPDLEAWTTDVMHDVTGSAPRRDTCTCGSKPGVLKPHTFDPVHCPPPWLGRQEAWA